MSSPTPTKLISFWQQELGVPDTEIVLAQEKGENLNLLPMLLWQHGALTIEQLSKVFDWLETHSYESE